MVGLAAACSDGGTATESPTDGRTARRQLDAPPADRGPGVHEHGGPAHGDRSAVVVAPRLPARRRGPPGRSTPATGASTARSTRAGSWWPRRWSTTSTGVLRELFDARYPIERMEPVDDVRRRRPRVDRGEQHERLQLPPRHRQHHGVERARLRPGHRPQPAGEPLRGRRRRASPRPSRPYLDRTRDRPGRDPRRRPRRASPSSHAAGSGAATGGPARTTSTSAPPAADQLLARTGGVADPGQTTS